jgi:hypothetical protein
MTIIRTAAKDLAILVAANLFVSTIVILSALYCSA